MIWFDNERRMNDDNLMAVMAVSAVYGIQTLQSFKIHKRLYNKLYHVSNF